MGLCCDEVMLAMDGSLMNGLFSCCSKGENAGKAAVAMRRDCCIGSSQAEVLFLFVVKSGNASRLSLLLVSSC